MCQVWGVEESDVAKVLTRWQVSMDDVCALFKLLDEYGLLGTVPLGMPITLLSVEGHNNDRYVDMLFSGGVTRVSDGVPPGPVTIRMDLVRLERALKITELL